MSRGNLELGVQGEEIAVDLLKKNGYKIIARNYRTKLGEIDIIATQADTICFVEVKARRNIKFGLPEESVITTKQKHTARAALFYLKQNKLFDKKARFDVVSILFAAENVESKLIKNAFMLEEKYSY
ncbi:MAG: YraN family protein [Candidatus Omnitrophica bacterium]|nr:YraN family protein [Candidatus Omnitrophota bacterium]